MLVGLVRAGLATAEREVIKTGGKTIEVVRVRITAAGRKAIESELHRSCGLEGERVALQGRRLSLT